MMIGEDATDRADDATNECTQPGEPEDVGCIRIGHCFESPRATVADTIEGSTSFDEDTFVGIVITCIVLEILVVAPASCNIPEQIGDQLWIQIEYGGTLDASVPSSVYKLVKRRIHVPFEMPH